MNKYYILDYWILEQLKAALIVMFAQYVSELASQPLGHPDDLNYNSDYEEYTFGHHLFHDHKLNSKADFDNTKSVSILNVFSLKALNVKEHKLTQILNTSTLLSSHLSHPHAMPCNMDDDRFDFKIFCYILLRFSYGKLSHVVFTNPT